MLITTIRSLPQFFAFLKEMYKKDIEKPTKHPVYYRLLLVLSLAVNLVLGYYGGIELYKTRNTLTATKEELGSIKRTHDKDLKTITYLYDEIHTLQQMKNINQSQLRSEQEKYNTLYERCERVKDEYNTLVTGIITGKIDRTSLLGKGKPTSRKVAQHKEAEVTQNAQRTLRSYAEERLREIQTREEDIN